LGESIIGRAQKSGHISVFAHNIRDYSENKHRKVDDTPYGGGRGMLMATQPIYDCYLDVKKKQGDGNGKVIYMSPRGRIFNHEVAKELSQYDSLTILCGHYEGIDQRVIDEIVDEEISIGDYVLTGGELPAMVLADSISRMLEGVLPNDEAKELESHYNGLLEYPQYTRPYEFHGVKVPDVLISGHHENIDRWRREQAMALTLKNRPDILEKYGKE
jgi:tRNA (guanine37-N1)-methyltransferase